MSPGTAKHVRNGQLSLALFAGVSVALHPGFVLKWNEGGFSNYGIHAKTFIPYSIAFLLAAYFSLRAASTVGRARVGQRIFKWTLRAYALLMFLNLVSTYGYTRSLPLKDFHTTVGIVTMLFEPAVSVWMYLQLGKSSYSKTLLAGVLVGLLLGVIDYFGFLHILFMAQVVTATSFGFMLVRCSALIAGE